MTTDDAAPDGVERRPWWYSGGDADVPDDPQAPPEAEPEPTPPNAGMDWSMLMMGAAKMVDWATERVMAPHAEHEDPAEHPQCVVCRTILLVGDSEGLGVSTRQQPIGEDEDAAASELPTTAQPPGAIRWIPIVDAPTPH